MKKVKELCPDVVIMDLTMPVMGGIETTRKIMETNPDSKVLVLSMLQEKGVLWNA